MTKVLGVNKRGHPSQMNPSGYMDYKVVLWEAGDETHRDLRASIGQGPAEWVARNGDPVSLQEALIHFPLLRQAYPDIEEIFTV